MESENEFIDRMAQELDVSPDRARQALANLMARGLIASEGLAALSPTKEVENG